MDLNFTSSELAFRDEVHTFLDTKLPKRLSEMVRNGQHLSKADQEEWHAILNEKGWLANHWPKEHGGTGWTAVEKFIFENECALAHAPRVLPFGLSMLGPVLIKYGNDQQKSYWLPRILNGQDWWCQGYSEPGAGSDLAALKTTAVRDGDDYIINGQKTWTTQGQHANMIFCLVRTSKEGKKQEGISFILVDMTTPGIEVRPIKTIDGGFEVNEVFFSDVRVPAENLVGEENKGWTCAKYLLTYERTNIAGVGFSVAALEKLKAIAADQQANEDRLIDDPQFAARLAKVEIELENMKTTNLRVIAAVAGGGVPGAESSMLKVKGTEIRQEITSLTRRAVGSYALPYNPPAFEEGFNGPHIGPDYAAPTAKSYFNNRKLSIFGGSNEIQKNIISKMILGL
ncbi:acyl-CoA dehydrogenase family protein [Terasakiella pusilla]|uniref:acyl-CoA dehydrogenase family protein n=1 Tax=Terasakiella pusilla TaxID=64973 RepID=UPI003AA918F3